MIELLSGLVAAIAALIVSGVVATRACDLPWEANWTLAAVGGRLGMLDGEAYALILDIGARYNGHNNGDLAAPWSWMQKRGWRSKDTLLRALREVQSYGMIEQTKQGGLHGPSLYAFTWMPIDPCNGKLDVAPTVVPSGKWKATPQPAPVTHQKQNATPTTGAEVVKISPHSPDHRVHKL